MIDYIIYPNPRIDQELLFESIQWYNENQNVTIFIRIVDLRIWEITPDRYELKLYFEIRTNRFKCKAYHYKDGLINPTKPTELVNATNEVVTVKYFLNGHSWKYKIEVKDPVFNLVNYALQQRNVVLPGNNQGLNNVDSMLIENALNGLDFKAIVSKNENGQLILEARPKDQCKVNYTLK